MARTALTVADRNGTIVAQVPDPAGSAGTMLPAWLKPLFRNITADHISQEDLVAQLNEALKLPGLSNAWTMPIKGRIDMLTTGIRTPVGLKISGGDLAEIEQIGADEGAEAAARIS